MGLAQQWDQLNQLGMRIKHNLEQQIQARNQSGVSEDALKEFSMMFRHFDKDKSGRLNHNEFKSCLRALGKTVIYEIIYLLLSIDAVTRPYHTLMFPLNCRIRLTYG